MMHLHCNVNVWEVKTAYLASVWVCVVPRVPVSLLAHSSVGPAPVASSGTMSSSAPRSERPTHPGRCTFPSESAATWLCVCVQSFTARCVKKKGALECIESAPGCQPCSWALSLTHSPHTLAHHWAAASSLSHCGGKKKWQVTTSGNNLPSLWRFCSSVL